MKHEITTLPNGLRVVTVNMPGAQSVTASILVGVGSRYEDYRKNGGVTHFLEHLFFKGTQKRPSTKIISEQIDAVGGYQNAYTSTDITNYYVKVPKGNLPLALDIISDMLLNSLFDPEEIDRERGTVIEEINMYNDDPASYVRNLSPQLLWPNHPLGHDTLGTKEIIDTISRDDIVAYKNKHYSPENMVVVAAGAAKHDEVVKLASKFLGDMKRQEVIKPLPVPPSISPKMVETKEKDTAQTHMVIAARSYAPKHANHQAANILAAILGRGLSSRLFLNVRERKGLAYAINASNQTYADAGEFEIYAGVNNEKVADAIEAILEELEEIRTNKVPETELSKAKNQLAGGLRMSLESNNAVANRLGAELILLKEVRDIEDVIDDINAVTAEDVTRVAKEILDPKLLRMAVISAHPDVAQKAFERKVKGR